MAFNSISAALIQVGKPIIKTLWDLTKDNFDDHEGRIAGVEQGATKIEIWNSLVRVRINASSLTGLSTFKVPANMRLLEATVSIFDKGAAAGTLEFDIKKSSDLDFSAAVSTFTTRPSLTMAAASDYEESANAVFDVNEQDLIKGERLKLDITSLPTLLRTFEVFLLAELN